MALDFTSEIRDAFVIGQYAYWAGDYDYAKRCFANCAEREVTKVDMRKDSKDIEVEIFESLEKGDNLLSYIADKRELRMADKEKSFETLVGTLPGRSLTVVSQPLVLETDYLRGAVWQLGTREFMMRAYLNSLEASNIVLHSAQSYAEKTFREPDSKSSNARPFNKSLTVGVYEWVADESPFVMVSVNDLMFIEASAYWTQIEMPKDFSPIKSSLQAVLDSLGKKQRRKA